MLPGVVVFHCRQTFSWQLSGSEGIVQSPAAGVFCAAVPTADEGSNVLCSALGVIRGFWGALALLKVTQAGWSWVSPLMAVGHSHQLISGAAQRRDLTFCLP